MTMKSYTVYYIVKANRQEYARSMVVTAGNARGACKRCRGLVYEKTGRNAFCPSTKKPERYESVAKKLDDLLKEKGCQEFKVICCRERGE